MKLADCEITHRVVRGQAVAFICGERGLSADEAEAMEAEYLAAYGAVQVPAYVSPDGWQTLQRAAALDAKPASKPAAKKAKA